MQKIIIHFLFFISGFSLFVMGLEEPQNLKGMEQKELQTPQGTWRYTVGNGGKMAILFIHGASSGKSIWKNQHTLDIKGYKNIFVDLLGYGESDKPDSGYSLGNWISGLQLILEKEQVDEICIVAHSNGVIIAKEFYRAYPDQISNLILLDGMLKPMINEQMLGWMKSTLEREDYQSFMENNIKNMVVEGLSDADVELLKTEALNTPKAVTSAELDMVSSPKTWNDLDIVCPVTIVHSNNPLWNEDYVAWLKNTVPKLEFFEWNDTGHSIPLERADRLNTLITKSLQILEVE